MSTVASSNVWGTLVDSSLGKLVTYELTKVEHLFCNFGLFVYIYLGSDGDGEKRPELYCV